MIECVKFKSVVKGHLQGFADVFITKWGVEIHGLALYMKNGNAWVNMPSREFENEEGKKAYAPIIRFRDTDHRDAFCHQAKEAIDKWCLEHAPKVDAVNNFEEDVENQKECPF